MKPETKTGHRSRRAVVVAGHLEDEATAQAGTKDADPKVRASAFGALARMGALSDNCLRDALGDPSPVVRTRAAALTVNRSEVSPSGLLNDPCDEVVEVAAWACGEREFNPQNPAHQEVVSRLSELTTNHSDPLIREAAVAALGAIEDPAGLEAILAATSDRTTVRRRAVLALASFEGPKVDAALIRASTDRDWQVREAAELLTP